MNMRDDFPSLAQKVRGKSIIYLDSACMSLKPRQVIEKMLAYYKEYPGCAGRSAHTFARRVDEEVAVARRDISRFFNAKSDSEIIFTRNTTEGINLIAHSLGLRKGEVVITTDKEHNSNLIPWLVLRDTVGIEHKVVPFGDTEALAKALTKNVKLVSMVHSSNADGTSINAAEIIKIAHENGSLVMLDAAQSAPHREVDVRKLDVDFVACSGHKMLGPSGIGALYGRRELLDKLNPFMTGGDTVKDSTYDHYELLDVPERFEAGLQNYSGIIGFGEAVKYLKRAGMKSIEEQEKKLNKIITDGLEGIDGFQLLGPKDPILRGGIVSFNLKGMDPHEVALMLNEKNIMVRSGAHCVHSWFNAQHLQGSARASLYLYNNEEDAEALVDAVREIAKLR